MCVIANNTHLKYKLHCINIGMYLFNLCQSGGNQPLVLVDKLKAITTIGINRPEKRNCINFETAKQLSAAIADFEEDSNSSIAVLYGCGGTFCAGFDLSELSSSSGKYDIAQLEEGFGFMVHIYTMYIIHTLSVYISSLPFFISIKLYLFIL